MTAIMIDIFLVFKKLTVFEYFVRIFLPPFFLFHDKNLLLIEIQIVFILLNLQAIEPFHKNMTLLDTILILVTRTIQISM